MNVIAQLEFELAYYDDTVQNISHSATSTSQYICWRADRFENESSLRFEVEQETSAQTG